MTIYLKCWSYPLKSRHLRDGLTHLECLPALWTLVGKWGVQWSSLVLDTREQPWRVTSWSQLMSEECVIQHKQRSRPNSPEVLGDLGSSHPPRGEQLFCLTSHISPHFLSLLTPKEHVHWFSIVHKKAYSFWTYLSRFIINSFFKCISVKSILMILLKIVILILSCNFRSS